MNTMFKILIQILGFIALIFGSYIIIKEFSFNLWAAIFLLLLANNISQNIEFRI